ncbi:hypothetical protein K492DRAFT_102025, partial [Lichtheimia hyalospora FSU 10163]
YKTKLCNYFDKYGKCNNNDDCKFAHGKKELRCLFDEECYKTKLCNYFDKYGKCNNNDDCKFAH